MMGSDVRCQEIIERVLTRREVIPFFQLNPMENINASPFLEVK
jgi:hypothetical protein